MIKMKYRVGIDIGGTNLRCAIFNENNEYQLKTKNFKKSLY